MAKKVIDDSNLGYLVSKAKAAFGPKEDVININLADVATSGNYNDLSNKPTIPDVSNFITNSVNNLTNYYLKSETYTKEEVAALIGAIQQFHYEIAASTSAVTSPASNVLYLIGPTGSGADRYEEYVYSSGGVKIGDTSIDLSGYVTTTFLSTELAKYATIASLAAVATSGNYNDLSNKPTIPEDKIFIAEDGVTTYSDILTAYNGGKIIFVKSGNLFYPLIKFDQTSSPNKFVFAIFNPEENSYITASLNSGGGAWVHSMSAPNLFEYAGNKVNSITGNESNTTKYPSTKAVADALSGLNDVKYTAQNLTDAQKAQARTNIGATAPEIFWAEYGVTTVAEIKAQVDAGKAVYLLYASPSMFSIPLIYFLSVSTSQAAMFYSSWLTMYLGIQVSLIGGESVGGEVEMFTPEDSGNKVTSWQNTPDNTHFPSEKLVKDSLDAKQPTIDANHKLDYSLITNTPTIPAAQVNADGEATSGLAEILNKPTIPTTYAGSPTAGGFANKTVAIPFGTVDATSTSTVLTATVDNFPEQLSDGVCAYIRNNAVASASGYTLNINGTGALPVYVSNADDTRSTTIFNASTTFLFVYNSSRVSGGCGDIYYGYNSNDNTIGYNLRTNGASTPPASQKYYRYRLLFTSANGQNLVPANTSSSTSATAAKTVNQTKIDPFGVIFYYSNTSAVNASSSPSASYLWLQYNGIALGYSFNRTGAALTMTTRDPVYLKCTPQSDGSAIMDADNPIVQALPTTADGKIYIFLGYAESATALTLYYWHPVYYHDGTKIAIGSGSSETNADVTFTEENGKYTIPKADIDKLIAGRPKNIKFVTNGSIVSTTLGSGTLSLEFLTLLAYSTDMFFGSNYVGMALMPHTFVVSPDTSDPTDPTKTEVTLGGHKFTYNATSETYEYDTNNPSADDYDDSVEFVINKVTSLSSTSTDVQYPSAKAVYTALSGKQDALTFDTTPTANSTNPVTSGGVYNAITENEEVVAAALNDLNDRLLDIDTSSMTSVTGAELVALRNNSQLKPGHQYRITDYVCDTLQSDTRALNNSFDIIVTANSTNKLDDNARAIRNFNSNSYFGSDLSRWELKYTLTNEEGIVLGAGEYGKLYIIVYNSNDDTYRAYARYEEDDYNGYYSGRLTTCGRVLNGGYDYEYFYTATSNPTTSTLLYTDSEGTQASDYSISQVKTYAGTGAIYYMKDDYENVAFHDFKNIQFKRYVSIMDEQLYFDSQGITAGCYTYSGIIYDSSNNSIEVIDLTNLRETNSYDYGGSYPQSPTADNYVGPYICSTGSQSFVSGQLLSDIVVYAPVPIGDSYEPTIRNTYLEADGTFGTNFKGGGIDCRFADRESSESKNNKVTTVTKDSSDYGYPSAKAAYKLVHPTKVTSGTSFSPNIPYFLGYVTGSKTWTLNTSDIDNNIANHYFGTFDTGSTAPTITGPSGLTGPGGIPPVILANKHYEISVLNNIAVGMEV